MPPISFSDEELAAMDGRAPLSGAVRLDLVVELPVPTSWSKKRTHAALCGAPLLSTKPDARPIRMANNLAMLKTVTFV